jgi:hypothetical protein
MVIPRWFYGVLAGLIGLVWLGQAFAQTQNCGNVLQVSNLLHSEYGETVQDFGIASNGALVQWWGNIDTGTWTIIAVTPDGTACLVASGEGFEHMPTDPAPMGEEG